MNLPDALGQRILFLDGAIGTEFYRRGVFINRCYDALSLQQPDLVAQVHRDWVSAGADLVTTNTFGANRVRLAAYGMQDQAREIVLRSTQLARTAAAGRASVLGSIGPTGAQLAPIGTLSPGRAYAAFKEQAQALAEGGVDGFLLETFTHLGELWQAVRAVRDLRTGLPVLATMSFTANSTGERVVGEDPAHIARTLSGWGVSALGVNCSTGPGVVLDVMRTMAEHTDLPLVAFPNAGMPQMVEGRKMYMASPEYMAEYARRFATRGATVIGGCCGTTPNMLREMRSFVRSVAPAIAVRAEGPIDPTAGPTPDEGVPEVPVAERSELSAKLDQGVFCVSVELDPPRGLDPSRALKGAGFLKSHGVDVINIADGPRATARMGPGAMAQLARAHCGIEPVVHVCCRDRNLLGLQMDLLGYHALGIRNVLAVTGDPPKMGNYPDATAVFDIDSVGLIRFLRNMNRGLDFSGRPLKGQTSFFIGAGCNPAHTELNREIDRFGQKIEAGAEYFFSQPLYDDGVLHDFLDRTEDLPKVPFFVGILPLASYKNAEFLHNEVPGMQVPDAIRARLKAAPSREAQREIGIEVARQTLEMAMSHPRVRGVYIYPPFGSYRAVLRVLDVHPRFRGLADA